MTNKRTSVGKFKAGSIKVDCTCVSWWRLCSSMMGVMELVLPREEYRFSADCLALVIWSCTVPGKP